MTSRLGIFLLFVLLLIQPVRAQPATLTIFAAASLTDVMMTMGDAFQDVYPETDFVFNFAGSSTLAAQIMQGAPADIFASASMSRMADVVSDELIDPDTVQVFAHNTLTLIVPQDNPADIVSAQDLAQPGVLLVLAVPGVPVRDYADVLLDDLNDVYGNDYRDAVMANLVSEETHVRRVAARIATGEADAGIVYRTDVTPDIADSVRLIALPEDTGPIAEYPIAPLLATAHPDLAGQFIDFVRSDTGQRILLDAGFCLPETTPPPESTPDADSSPEVTPEARIHSRCPQS